MVEVTFFLGSYWWLGFVSVSSSVGYGLWMLKLVNEHRSGSICGKRHFENIISLLDISVKVRDIPLVLGWISCHLAPL